MCTPLRTAQPVLRPVLLILILLLFGGFYVPCFAAQVTLAWDANADKPDGYRVFKRTDSTDYDYTAPAWSGPASSCVIDDLEEGGQYYFVVRAYAGSIESGDSNEAAYLSPVSQSEGPDTSGGSEAPTPETSEPELAPEVILAWDALDTAPDGYRLYRRTANTSYDYAAPTWSGTVNSATLDDLEIGVQYYFVVRAYVGDAESGDSNEVSYLYEATSTGGTDGGTNVDPNPPVVEKTYTIIASAGANGAISPSGSLAVTEGGSQAFIIQAGAGYHIRDVMVDNVSLGAVPGFTFADVAGDHSIRAIFAPDEFTISASAGPNGTISPSGNTIVTNGGSQTYSIDADTGYHISNVVVDGTSVGALASYTFTQVAAHRSIDAEFAANRYILSARATDGGAISPAGYTRVDFGDSLTYTIVPDTGYVISDVYIDGVSVGVSNRYTFDAVDSRHTIQAVFVAANEPPVADAGPDQAVDENATVTLSGLNSMDPDDGIAAFQWLQVEGPVVALDTTTDAEARFVAPAVDEQGEVLVFKLTVTDFGGHTRTDTCIVNVTWVNTPPVASAGDGQTVYGGDKVVLDASDSYDADNGIAGYKWVQRQGPAVTLCDDSAVQPTFTAPAVDVGGASIVFELTVTDGDGLQDTDSCVVTIVWENEPPVADAGPDMDSMPGQEISLDASQSTDPDDGIIGYQWKQTDGPPVALSDATAISPVFTVPEIDADSAVLGFDLVVTDAHGLQGTDSCQVFVEAGMAGVGDTEPPVLTVTNPYRSFVYLRQSAITISGLVSDNAGVARVVWENNRGYSGEADLGSDGKWQIEEMRLASWFNVVTITAYDTSGNEQSTTLMLMSRSRR